MKYLYLIACVIISCSVFSCSKKNNPAPMAHTIKVTASGTAQFIAIVKVTKVDATTSTTLDTRSVASGSYDFTTSLNSGDMVHLEIQTSSENTVSYTITDNAAIGLQQSGRELGSFSKLMADYTVKN